MSKAPDLREVERSIRVAWELGGRTRQGERKGKWRKAMREEGREMGKVIINEYRCSSWPSQFVLHNQDSCN